MSRRPWTDPYRAVGRGRRAFDTSASSSLELRGRRRSRSAISRASRIADCVTCVGVVWAIWILPTVLFDGRLGIFEITALTALTAYTMRLVLNDTACDS